MYKSAFYLAGIFIVSVWAFYFFNFPNGLSDKQDVWGQFGDFTGGVLNPILTFVTMMFLSKSLHLQSDANRQIIEDSKRNETLENLKIFEMQFYNLINLTEKSFNELNIQIDNVSFNSSQAVTKIEEHLINMIDRDCKKIEIVDFFNRIDPNDHIFGMVRNFALSIKKIKEKCPPDRKDEYFELCKNLTQYKALCLILILKNHFEWNSITTINESKILESAAEIEYSSHFKLKN